MAVLGVMSTPDCECVTISVSMASFADIRFNTYLLFHVLTVKNHGFPSSMGSPCFSYLSFPFSSPGPRFCFM
jgi:hypothetical protein